VILLFWLLAATLVTAEHGTLDRLSVPGSTVAEILTVIGVAFAYMRFAAREATVDHALGAGAVWLLLAVVAEIAITNHLHHTWCALLGTPNRPVLRNLFLFVWIFSPALFARRAS
jgi:hypothetical protein